MMRPVAPPLSRYFGPLCAVAALTVGTALSACGTDSGDPPGNTAGSPAATGGSSAGNATGGSAPTAGTSPLPTAGTSTSGGTAATAGSGAGGTGTAGSSAAGSGSGGSSNGGGSNGGSSAGGSGGGSAGGSSVSCPATVLKAGDTNETVDVGGTSRSYVLHVPAKYDGKSAVPLIVDFHPLGGSGPSEKSGSPYPAQTDSEGVIMAFPSGKSGPSGGAWNVGPCCVANTDDVAFAKALVNKVKAAACIDPKRVYAVGFSMGGGMSHYLACHASDVFAAVAPAAFDLLKENIDDCKPKRPISVVSFRGTGDSIVPYAGGYSAVVQGMPINFLGAKTTAQKWADMNQCSGAASAEDAKGCSSYSGCKDGVDVVLCTKQGGGHEAGNASVAWPILKKHVLP
ncbi:MAG TPA: PHB depolymerase family esterase [Polyangiaceae bacterium]|nr:PHB depolymerase family esterase [Polyangiaceae bacterium]